jgi:hypothetical protein
MPVLPGPLRATIGLVALAMRDARDFPTRAVELPVLAAGTALRLSARVQHQYLGLVSRGDDVLLRMRGVSEDAPPWATFDESPAPDLAAPAAAPAPDLVPPAPALSTAGTTRARTTRARATTGTARVVATAGRTRGARAKPVRSELAHSGPVRSPAEVVAPPEDQLSDATATSDASSVSPEPEAAASPPVTRVSRQRRRTKPPAPRDRPPSAFDQVADDPILTDES